MDYLWIIYGLSMDNLWVLNCLKPLCNLGQEEDQEALHAQLAVLSNWGMRSSGLNKDREFSRATLDITGKTLGSGCTLQ